MTTPGRRPPAPAHDRSPTTTAARARDRVYYGDERRGVVGVSGGCFDWGSFDHGDGDGGVSGWGAGAGGECDGEHGFGRVFVVHHHRGHGRVFGAARPTLAGGLFLSGSIANPGQAYYFIGGGIDPVAGGVTATGTHTLIGNDSAFVLIPGGTFQMGDSFGKGDSAEQPVHSVNVRAFFLQAKETTKAEWDEVRRWTVANGYAIDNAGLHRGAGHPLHSVNWFDVVKWCNARSQKEGLVPCYYTDAARTVVYRTGQVDVTNDSVHWSANGYRLPTEAEWEKAARGGLSARRFPWGDTITHSEANYWSSSEYAYDTSPTRSFHPSYRTGAAPWTSPVGSFAPNAYGLYDMTGNAEEWCWDWYGDTYYASSPPANPLGPGSGWDRVARGGSWDFSAVYGRVFTRYGIPPSNAYFDRGFRPARGQ